MIRLMTITVLLFLCMIANAQNIQEKVVDNNNEAADSAVIVLQTSDSVYVESSCIDSLKRSSFQSDLNKLNYGAKVMQTSGKSSQTYQLQTGVDLSSEYYKYEDFKNKLGTFTRVSNTINLSSEPNIKMTVAALYSSRNTQGPLELSPMHRLNAGVKWQCTSLSFTLKFGE